MLKLKHTNLYVIPVEAKSYEFFSEEGYIDYFNPDKKDGDGGYTSIDIESPVKILGTVTKDGVDFNTTNLISEGSAEINENMLRNIINAHDIYFENLLINPYEIEADWSSGERQRLTDKWEFRQKQLVEKLLIVRKC